MAGDLRPGGFYAARAPLSCIWRAFPNSPYPIEQPMPEAALDLLRRGELFGIYPEGTRSPDGKLYRGRTGIGWLALASGLPVIPVAMIGTHHVLPPGRVIPRIGPIEVRVGKPMTFEHH